jgi:hypothetical protein
MKAAVKTAVLEHDRVLLKLTSIILSMAKNHDSLSSFPARCLMTVAAGGPFLFCCFIEVTYDCSVLHYPPTRTAL